MNHHETIIVGGGLGGLAAATYLARAGARVRVLDKAAALGGRARSQDHASDGPATPFTFNLGPHALYRGGAAARVLEELGVRVEGGVPTGSGGLALAGGSTFMLPSGPLSLLATGLLPLGAKLELARFLARLPRVDAE
ncbi:MAG TPA: NAD(P)-binding protein, partial [Minicystis sp.]|nr:NAD(P)-binding protein [Minicystis sp.]